MHDLRLHWSRGPHGLSLFFYVPSRWEAEGPRMVLKITRLQMVRDVMLAGGFLIRAMTVSASSIRAFFRRMATLFPHCRRF